MNAAGGFVTQGQMEWTRARASAARRRVERPPRHRRRDARRHAGAARRCRRRARGARRFVAGSRTGSRGEVVSCRIVKQFGADTVAVAAGHPRRDRRARAEPAARACTIRVVYDQSQLVEASLGGVGRAVLIGAVLVALVLFVLLGDVRAALLVTLTIPLSIALSGHACCGVAGIGLNTMTLGGLAIAVGLLVDASIIVVENIVPSDHRSIATAIAAARRRSPPRSRSAGRSRSRPLIVIAVFLPLFAMSGIEGRMYQPLAAAVIAAVVAALVLALALVPVVAARRAAAAARRAPDDVCDHSRASSASIAPLLDACAASRRARRASSTLAITVPALWLATRLGSDFMPRARRGRAPDADRSCPPRPRSTRSIA